MKIMFICTGNTCRSAMAHHLMEKKVKEKHLNVQVYSCGIYANTGDGATDEAIEVMEEYGVDMKCHRATNIAKAPLEKMNLILCMTTGHKQIVMRMYPDLKEKIFTLKEYAEKDKAIDDKNIDDPWGYTLATYRACASQIDNCLEKILDSWVNSKFSKEKGSKSE